MLPEARKAPNDNRERPDPSLSWLSVEGRAGWWRGGHDDGGDGTLAWRPISSQSFAPSFLATFPFLSISLILPLFSSLYLSTFISISLSISLHIPRSSPSPAIPLYLSPVFSLLVQLLHSQSGLSLEGGGGGGGG